MLNRRVPDQSKTTMPMSGNFARLACRGAVCALTAIVLAACTTPARRTAAPVVEHSPATTTAPPVTSTDSETVGSVPPGVNTYVVKRGDTLNRIARAHGIEVSELIRWNNLSNPNQIEVGQELQLRSPSGGAVVPAPVAGGPQVAPIQDPSTPRGRPLDAPPGTGVTDSTPARPTTPPSPPPGRSDRPDDRIDWAWPANGALIEGFSESGNKGLDIGGNPGDPVVAAADGKVKYSGSGLRGYGNLIIIQHNGTYLSAYAHNRTLLVKEGQDVKRGQRIAELGSTDAATPRLHFEIRRQGKPVDPSGFLPAR